MKNLFAIFAFLVLMGLLVSCHPEQIEGDPFTVDDWRAVAGGVSSSSSSSSSLRSSSSLSSSSGLRSSSSSSSSIVIVTGSLYDSRDGQSYRAVVIGSQTWMAENLNYNASGSKCYDNQDSYCDTYGRLYNWETAKTACPSGWHLPSQYEWNELSNYVGGSDTEGKHLKATNGWDSNGNGLDIYGFAALPGGYGVNMSFFGNDMMFSDISFYNVGSDGFWWSASEYDSHSVYSRLMDYRDDFADWYTSGKSNLYSVRCIQD